jgi:tetratricopeptide (TPR) repeat protein
VILRVNLETSAYQERLQAGDMIVALTGTPITSEEQLTRYFRSLDNKGDDFSVIKAGETQPTSIRVPPGSPGRIPQADSEAAYTHYLRARDDINGREAIREYTLAIELAPQFDAAYVQRGKAYAEKNGDEQAAADLNKAIELDPRLATAYRERASLDLHRDNDATQTYLRRAIELDNCETGFKRPQL